MNPTISLTRQNGNATFNSLPRKQNNFRTPQFFRRLFKFPQMDFEMAVWEMTHLLVAPKKVFRNIYYHKQTKNTYHRADPSFTYLLAFFMALTGIAWGVAASPGATGVIRLALIYVFVHLILISLFIATVEYVLVGRFLGRKDGGSRGLFTQLGREGEAEGLEFGYAFDVAIRAFFPLWFLLYVLQFILWPVIKKEYFASLFLGNSLYLIAVGYYSVITFLGYNALPFLKGQVVLLWPALVMIALWVFSLFGFNIPMHVVPIFALGSGSHPSS